MMDDGKKYPIVLLKDLNEVKIFVKNNGIRDFRFHKEGANLIFEIYADKENFHFVLSSYKFENNGLLYSLDVFPFSELSNSPLITTINSENLLKYLVQWYKNVTLYKDYEHIFETDLVAKPTSKNLNSKTSNLPICLKQLQVKNYNAIKSAEIIDIPIDSQWIFLIGENGFGKTLILQSIFIGLYGLMDENKLLNNNENLQILVEYNDNKESDNIKTISLSNQNSKVSGFDKIVAIGASRLNLTNESNSEANEKNKISYSLFNSDGMLSNIDYEMYKLAIKKEDNFEKIKNALLTLLSPNITNINYDNDLDCILYFEKDKENDVEYEPLKYEQLASGFKSIIGIAGDIIIRLSKKQKFNQVEDLEGIVLIDEIDLHWHPKLQIKITESLTKVFPKIQFIVSTHSPIPLLGAPLNSKVYKVNRTKEEGVTIENIDLNFKSLTPNLLLTSPAFDMDSISSIHKEFIADVAVEATYEALQKNKEMESIIHNLEENKKSYPESLFNVTPE